MEGKKIIKWIVFIIIAAALIYILEGWGALGILIFILAIAAHRMWQMRDNIKLTMQQIEMMIWQKPLDKEQWKKGELKDTRVKVVWGKGVRWHWYNYSSILLYPAILLIVIGLGFNKYYLIIVAASLLFIYTLGNIIRGFKNAQYKKHRSG